MGKNTPEYISDIILDHDYFKIETVYPFSITKSFIAFFSDNNGNFNWKNIKEHRQVNYKRGIPLNNGFPIMEEEIIEIIKKNAEGKTITELQKYFQRPLVSIAKILEKNLSELEIDLKTKSIGKERDDDKITRKFFRIENLIDFTPMVHKRHQVIKTIFTKDEILKRRNENKKNGKLLNHGFPITVEETECILEFYSKGKSLLELEEYFQRSRKSISYILEREGILKENSQENLDKEDSNEKWESCVECGDEIAKGRLELIPNTKFCVSCAENKDPQSRKNRKINETWGTREDWKRDRSSWKRTH